MATQNTLFRTSKATTPALLGFALPFLHAGPVEQASLHFDDLLCAVASEVLKYVPSIILTVGQAAGSYALDHVQFFQCLETLVTFGGVLRLLTGVA